MQQHGLVRGTIFKLSPVMSWMMSVFQVLVWSGSHPIVQEEPCWKTCPGLGDVGVTSAKAVNAMDKATVEKALRENIEDGCCCVGKRQKTGGKQGGSVRVKGGT